MQAVKDVVSRNLPSTGLESHLTLLDHTQTFFCPGHLASRQCNLTDPQFPVADFHNYASYIASLQFGSNDLVALPEDFFALFTNLVDLDLSDNKLTSIPLGIGHCKKLSYIRYAFYQLCLLIFLSKFMLYIYILYYTFCKIIFNSYYYYF